MDEKKEPIHLDYRPPERSGSGGCGAIVIQAVAGSALVFLFLVFPLPYVSRGIGHVGAIWVGAIVSVVAVAVMILWAKRYPGLLIGFAITGSLYWLLVSQCGGILLR